DGKLVGFQQLEDASTAKSVRIRNGRTRVVDGPFAETKEILGGFNLIEAADMDEAVRIAAEVPWARTGCIEVRAVRDVDAVRRAAPDRHEAVRIAPELPWPMTGCVEARAVRVVDAVRRRGGA